MSVESSEINEYEKSVAHVALCQLCGLDPEGRQTPVAVMRLFVGGENFVRGKDENGDVFVKFSFRAKSKNKANLFKITFKSKDDLYQAEFFRIVDGDAKEIDVVDGLYGDMLKPHFEESTGLYLSLN